jgi:hypothetical protein
MIRLSVVVTVVDAGAALERCLAALAEQQGTPELEVIIPFDATVHGMDALALRYPAMRFLPLGNIATQRRPASAAGQHELFDRRRSAGLAAASGDLVAILEDRGVPRANWATEFLRLHAELPHAVIGGAVAPGRSALLNRAVFACDFARYQPPFEAGPREYITDVNICYKRRAIEQTRELWRERYHETTVHWALIRAGETLFLHAAPRVDQMRDDLSLRRLWRERVDWGRLFAYTRARESALPERLLRAAASPLLPALLLWRILRQTASKGLPLVPALMAAPATLLLLVAWSAGEMLGYLTGRP